MADEIMHRIHSAGHDLFESWDSLYHFIDTTATSEQIQYTDHNNETTLIHAVRFRCPPNIAKILIDRGVNVHFQSYGDGYSVIHWALARHDPLLSLIQLLLEHGADLNKPGYMLRNNDDSLYNCARTPMYIASCYLTDDLTLNLELFDLLLTYGGELSETVFINLFVLGEFITPTFLTRILRDLPNPRQILNTTTHNGQTALLAAIDRNGSAELVDSMLRMNIDMSALEPSRKGTLPAGPWNIFHQIHCRDYPTNDESKAVENVLHRWNMVMLNGATDRMLANATFLRQTNDVLQRILRFLMN